MKKTKLKRIFLISPLIVLVLTSFFFSCIKEGESNGRRKSNKENSFLTPEVAQAVYQERYDQIVPFKTMSRTQDDDILIKPLWNQAKSSSNDLYEIVELPLGSNRPSVFIDQQTRHLIESSGSITNLRNNIKLVVKLDKKQAI